MGILRFVLAVLLFSHIFAQDKKSIPKEQSKIARQDTLVSRLGLINDLREQQKAVKDNAERVIANIEGQIQALQIQTADSLWVKKEIFHRGR